jgi:hypothetical protein
MPYEPDDFVVLRWKDGRLPSIKRLRMAAPPGWERWHPESEVVPFVVVEQLNPPKRYGATTDKLSAIHRVVGSFKAGVPGSTGGIAPRRLKEAAGGAS